MSILRIDYAAIIAKAEQRKNTLKDLETLVSQSPHMDERAKQVHEWLKELKDMYGLLDEEGRLMLPPELKAAFDNLSNTVIESGRVVSGNHGGVCHGISAIAAHAPKEG